MAQLCLDKSFSWTMFDRIYRRYDFMTGLFSLGLDGLWRRRVRKFLAARPGQQILDVATGTASLLMTLVKSNSRVQMAYGIDLSQNMLKVGRQRIQKSGLAHKIILQKGDALNIPFPSMAFDAATMGFGIRNVSTPELALREIHRVLKDGGRALILEFSLPAQRAVRAVAVFYIQRIIPLIGRLVLRDNQAYQYLHESILEFPFGEDFCRIMQNAGFHEVKAHGLCLGMATIYAGRK